MGRLFRLIVELNKDYLQPANRFGPDSAYIMASVEVMVLEQPEHSPTSTKPPAVTPTRSSTTKKKNIAEYSIAIPASLPFTDSTILPSTPLPNVETTFITYAVKFAEKEVPISPSFITENYHIHALIIAGLLLCAALMCRCNARRTNDKQYRLVVL